MICFYECICFVCAGDVRPFIRNIFKTHELVDKARNGDRDALEDSKSLHYPALTPPGSSSQEADRTREAGAGAGAGATAAAVAADAGGGAGASGSAEVSVPTAAE